MALVTCFLLWLMSSHNVLTSAAQSEICWKEKHGNCPKCRQGEYLTNCRCQPCRNGTYTSERNCESSCHRCFADCRPEVDLHLKVVEECSSTSNLRCECEKGFHCVSTLSGNCQSCQRTIPPTGLSTPAGEKLCSFHTCSPESISAISDQASMDLFTILYPLCVIGALALLLLLCLRHRNRFKQTMKKCCAVETIEARHRTRAKQKAVPLTTANMGPVHVHNPGTVVFSLLGEFKGQIGQMTEGKTDEVHCPMYPPASPTQHLYEELPRGLLPLSKEEHPEVSLPSQEQGKGSLVPIEVCRKYDYYKM